MARSTEACIARVMARGSLGKKEATDLIEDLAERAERMRATGVDDPVMTTAWQMARDVKETAKRDLIDRMRNADIRTSVTDRVRSEGGIAKAAQVLRSIMHWVPGASALDSIEGRWHFVSRQWRATLGHELEKAGVFKAATSGQLDDQVAEAMWRAHGGAPDSSVTISDNAQKIADALTPTLDLARDRQNAEGARIGDATDYVTRSTWDSRQLRAAAGPGGTQTQAFEAWWAKERPRMADKTFDDLELRDGETRAEAERRMGRAIFDATESGIHMRSVFSGAASDGDYVPPAFEGTRNLGKAVSHQRVVYWKDAASWLAHQREFGGGGSLYSQIDRTLDGAARRMALMHNLGTNPSANLNMIIRKIQEEYRTSDGLEAFQKQVAGLENVMGRLDGTFNIPINEDWARRAEAVLTWEAASHLGGVALTHLAAAPATVTAELAQHGVSHFEGLGRVLKAITTGRGAAEVQEIMADAGAYAQGYALQLQMANRDPGVLGAISWGAAHFMRLTGLEHFLGKLQADGVKSVLMTKLGRAADRGFAELDPQQAGLLSRYGIGEKEWDLLRNGSDPLHVEGLRYITPRDALKTDRTQIADLLRDRGVITDKTGPEQFEREITRFQWDLGDRYGMYLNDAAEHATVTPGVRERAMAYGNLRPGDVRWMLWRFLGQFKMWPIAAYNQIVGREIGYNLGNNARIAANIGWLLALSTAGGALRMSVNDAVVGNPQRDYRNPLTLLAALAQGGGLGIYGDFLFGETSRLGAGLVATVGGPVASDADRLISMFERFKQDLQGPTPNKAIDHVWPDLAHFAVGHIPFGNLIYLKGALDYLLWYHLYEAASPGWWERTNRRLLKERGRVIQGYRPGAPVPYSPF